MLAVVITPPPGPGKSSVLMALSDALSDDDVPHAAVEVESLVWTHPALSDEQWRQHVRVHCRLMRDAGHTVVLLAQTLESDQDVADLLSAVEADAAFLVRLEARGATLAERIIAREPASWSGLPALVEHAQQLATTMPRLARIDLVVSTEAQRPEQVAEHIRNAVRALSG